MKSRSALKDHFKKSLYLTIPHIIILTAIANLMNRGALYTLLNPVKYFKQSLNSSFFMIFGSFTLFIIPEHIMRIDKICIHRVLVVNLLSKLMFLQCFSFLPKLFYIPSRLVIFIIALATSIADIYEVAFSKKQFIFYANCGLIPAFYRQAPKILDNTMRQLSRGMLLGTCIYLISKLAIHKFCLVSENISVSMFLVAKDILIISIHMFAYTIFTSTIFFCYIYNLSLTDERHLASIAEGTTETNRFYYHQLSDKSRSPLMRNKILRDKRVISFLKASLKNELACISQNLGSISSGFDAVENKKFYVIPVILYNNERIPTQLMDEDQKQVFKKIKSYNFIEIFSVNFLMFFSLKKLANELSGNIFWLRDMVLYVETMQKHDDIFGLSEGFFLDLKKDLDDIKNKLHVLESRTRNTVFLKNMEELLTIIKRISC